MSVTLGTVTDDGNLLTFEDREIAVVLVPDLCSHCDWHSFLCSGVNAFRRSGFYHSQMNSRVFVHGFCPANWGLSYRSLHLAACLVHKVSRETVKIRRGNGKFHVF